MLHEAAIQARKRNAEIRAQIRRGKIDLNGLLTMLAFTPELKKMSLATAIAALPGVSPQRARRILEVVDLSVKAKLEVLETPKGKAALEKIELMLYPEKRKLQKKMNTGPKAPHPRWPWAGEVTQDLKR
jgi:hypothetical protein